MMVGRCRASHQMEMKATGRSGVKFSCVAGIGKRQAATDLRPEMPMLLNSRLCGGEEMNLALMCRGCADASRPGREREVQRQRPIEGAERVLREERGTRHVCMRIICLMNRNRHAS